MTDFVVNNSLTFDAQHIDIRFKSIHQINIKYCSHILAAQIRDFVSHDASLRLCWRCAGSSVGVHMYKMDEVK